MINYIDFLVSTHKFLPISPACWDNADIFFISFSKSGAPFRLLDHLDPPLLVDGRKNLWAKIYGLDVFVPLMIHNDLNTNKTLEYSWMKFQITGVL